MRSLRRLGELKQPLAGLWCNRYLAVITTKGLASATAQCGTPTEVSTEVSTDEVPSFAMNEVLARPAHGRPNEASVHLPPQDVEKVGRSGDVPVPCRRVACAAENKLVGL